MLEKLGAKTEFSCEGHPTGFYIVFTGPAALAFALHSCGFFHVQVEGKNRWSIRLGHHIDNEAHKQMTLTFAAKAWVKAFGPIESFKKRT